jgi:maleamate amidohydrolase
VDGLQHGFRVMVVREAVGDRDPDAHLQSLLDMQQKYADVVSIERVERYASDLAAGAMVS